MKVTRFLWGVFAFFMIGLVVVWVLAHRAHPVLLDEHGKPLHSMTDHP
jgi:hypothetical protein